jgi:hypothetical protein
MAATIPKNPPTTAPAVDSKIVVEGLGRCVVSATTCEYVTPGTAMLERSRNAADRTWWRAENDILSITKSQV